MGSYIKKIKHNLMRYYPEDFLKVEQRIQELEKETSVNNSQNIEQQNEFALKDLKGLNLHFQKTDQGSETKACRHKAGVFYNKSAKDSFDQMNSTAETLDKQKNQKQATKKHEHQNQY